MSDREVIVISSDEDPDSVSVSEEKKYINNIYLLQTSIQQLKNYWASEISSIDYSKSSVNTTLKENEENYIHQSDNFYSMATDTEYSSENFETVRNFLHLESEPFKKFISVVLPAEPNERDRARIVKKLNKYLNLADPKYIRSPEFNKILEKGAAKINEDTVYLYFVLKDVKDCLLSNKVKFRNLKTTEGNILSSNENGPEKPEGNSCGSDDREDVNKEERKHKIVNKLTTLLKKVDEKIKELEELEVDFSDEEDSSYFKMQKYRERFCQVYEKLCNYTTQPLNGNRVGGFRKINFSDTDNLELNRAIEKWLNKTKQFPDYSDVIKVMTELNQSLNLKLSKEEVKIKAQQIFEKIGNMLQRRRHFDLWDSLSSFLNTDADPAVKNPELESMLQKNYDLGVKKEKELLKYYVERQEREQLQPHEVPEEEANCSPTESGDEDEEEIDIIENMLDSKISAEVEENGNENEESDDDPFCCSESETRNVDFSAMDFEPETRVENYDPQRASVLNDNCEQIDGIGSKDIHLRVNSEQTETVGTSIRPIPAKYDIAVGAIPNMQDTEDNLVISNETTSIKTTTNKYALCRENKVKRKSKNTLKKPEFVNTITWLVPKNYNLKNNDWAISTGTNSINCPMDQEQSAENMKSQKKVNKTNQSNGLQGSSNEATAPPSGGSSSGGNGQDNSENNGNKKPFGRETQTEDNPENEDKEEDEEEDTDTPKEKPPETPRAVEAAPKLTFSRTYQKVSRGAVFKQPPTEKVVPVRRNSLGKQSGKPPSSEITQRKEPLNSPPTTRSLRARPPSVPKKKINQNGGIKGTPRKENVTTFTFQFEKAPPDLKKLSVNKPIPTASSSRDDDVEIIQVTKKKRSTPVKSVQSDEEIVKNFLERSHPSISITTPRKKPVQKEPSASVRQALETLSRLKGISATIVKGSSKHNADEEVTIIGESLNTRANKISKQEKTPASSATAAASTEPLLPKIVTVQGNVPGFEDTVGNNMANRDNSHQTHVQNPQAALANVSGTKNNYNEHFYGTPARLSNVSGNGSYYNEHTYSAQAPVASVPGSASTYQQNCYGPQAPAHSISGGASTYEENFTGKVECIPIPRFRNIKSRSRRTPKKTKNIEYVILD